MSTAERAPESTRDETALREQWLQWLRPTADEAD